MGKRIILIVLFLAMPASIFAQKTSNCSSIKVADASLVYKKVDGESLRLYFFFPAKYKESNKYPTVVFFHGGGWNGGGPSHFFNQAAYLASRGMIAVSVEYRTKNQHKTTPKECVKDAKSAIRWVRKHAAEYGIDTDKIVAAGGSAGGHLAAAMGTLKGCNETGDDLSISCIPAALVLFNPVANNGPKGYGYNRVKDYWETFSPYHNIDQDTPPTLIMLGSKDKLFTSEMAQDYKAKMEKNGKRCDLIVYEGEDHAFFNIDKTEKLHFQTMKEMDVFLKSLNFLKGKSTINKFKRHLCQN